MAGSATLTVEQAVLGHTLGFSTMTAVTAVFIALDAASPAPTNTTPGAEVVGNGYARQPCTFALLTTPANVAANTTTIAYPAATASWGGLGYWEVWSALTGGQRLYWGPLVDPADGVTPITRTVLGGDIVRFQAGVIQIVAT